MLTRDLLVHRLAVSIPSPINPYGTTGLISLNASLANTVGGNIIRNRLCTWVLCTAITTQMLRETARCVGAGDRHCRRHKIMMYLGFPTGLLDRSGCSLHEPVAISQFHF